MYRIVAVNNAAYGQKMVCVENDDGDFCGWRQENFLWWYPDVKPMLFETEDEALDFAWEHGFYGATYYAEGVGANDGV
jgi:hypothetical protein